MCISGESHLSDGADSIRGSYPRLNAKRKAFCSLFSDYFKVLELYLETFTDRLSSSFSLSYSEKLLYNLSKAINDYDHSTTDRRRSTMNLLSSISPLLIKGTDMAAYLLVVPLFPH